MPWIRIPPPPQAVPPTRTKSPGAAESTRRIETPVPGKDWKGTAATVHAHTHTQKKHTHTHKYYGQYNYARMVCKYTDAPMQMLLHLQHFKHIAASTHARIHAWLHTYTYKCVQASRWLCVSLTALHGVFGMYEYLQCRSLNRLLVPTWR